MNQIAKPVAALTALGLVIFSLVGCSTGTASAPTPTTTAAADAVKPGEEWIVYQGPQNCGANFTDPSTICLERPDGTGRHKLLDESDELLHPDWSPDGSKVVFDAAGGQEIWSVNADGSHVKKVARCSQFDGCTGVDFPAWSRDGKTIAFTIYDGGNLPLGPPAESEIGLADVASGKAQTIGQSTHGDVLDQPRWSPDGKRLVVEIDRFDQAGNQIGAALAILNSSGGTAAPITDFANFGTYPDWNPKSDRIAFETGHYNPAGGPIDIQFVNPDGSNLVKLVYPGSAFQLSEMPTWTPDGKQLYFDEWGTNTAGVINPDGTGKSLIAGYGAHARLRPIP